MALAPPPPSYSDEYLAADKGPQVLASICAVAAASTLFVAARLFVRGVIKKNIQIDDYLIILSTVSMALTATTSGGLHPPNTMSTDKSALNSSARGHA